MFRRLKSITTLGHGLKKHMSTAADEIYIEKVNNKAILVQNRPDKLNAHTLRMQSMFHDCYTQIEQDKSVDLIIIKGVGDNFCAGGDVLDIAVNIYKDMKNPNYQPTLKFYRCLLNMSRSSKPVVTLSNGVCMGSGAALTAFATHPIVTERTVFSMPELLLGFFPNVGANYFLGD